MSLRNRKISLTSSDESSSDDDDLALKNMKLDAKLRDHFVQNSQPQKNAYHLTRIVLVRYLAFIYCKF